MSSTLFISSPEDYDGGELVVEDTYGTHAVKLPAGDMIVYPATSLHHVTPITRGSRIASFFWTQSMVRDDAKRTLLFDLDMAIIGSSRATTRASRAWCRSPRSITTCCASGPRCDGRTISLSSPRGARDGRVAGAAGTCRMIPESFVIGGPRRCAADDDGRKTIDARLRHTPAGEFTVTSAASRFAVRHAQIAIGAAVPDSRQYTNRLVDCSWTRCRLCLLTAPARPALVSATSLMVSIGVDARQR